MHRAVAQERGHASRLERRQGQGCRTQRPGDGANAARRPHRNVLRPHRPALHHHRDGPRKPRSGHGARDTRALDVPEQRPQRHYRGHQRAAGSLLRLCRFVSARDVGEFTLHRSRRFRHHRRLVGDHGREHLPAYQFGRIRRTLAERADPEGHARGRTRPVFHDSHHGLRLRSSLHDAGAGGANLRTDGRYVRIRSVRRPHFGV